jgi:ribonuclease HII
MNLLRQDAMKPAAAVWPGLCLPPQLYCRHNFDHHLLNDSKNYVRAIGMLLRIEIEQTPWPMPWRRLITEIDQINILNASFLAMHRAIEKLHLRPEFLIIDGNRFNKYGSTVPHTCIVEGDGKYFSIAAASILAKTYRDDYMKQIAEQHPEYNWHSNKGYPTIANTAKRCWRKDIPLPSPYFQSYRPSVKHFLRYNCQLSFKDW